MPFQPDYDVPEGRRAYTINGKPREGWENIAVLMLHGFMGSPAKRAGLSWRNRNPVWIGVQFEAW